MNKVDRLREYVMRYATAREISEEEAMLHAEVRAFMEYLDEE